MENLSKKPAYPKSATCACRALTLSVAEPPQMVHVCACRDCQRQSGSAFSYNAFFPNSAVAISGEFRNRRSTAASGRWKESSFCPACGSTVFGRLEGLPGLVAVSVGCFNDQGFEKPAKLFWMTRRHHWLTLDIDAIETQ